MSPVVQFRPFKVPRAEATQFFTIDDSANKIFMQEDLAKSGLLQEDVHGYTTPLLRKEGSLAAYGIPYFGLDGNPIVDKEGYPAMYRARFRYPEFSKEQRYTQPPKEQLAKYDLPSYLPYLTPLSLSLTGEYLVCCEGEKKTASVLKHLGIPAFGIGGCQMWRDPTSGSGIHPWIRALLAQKGMRKILIVPDGDLYRYDICSAYGTFAHTLRAEGYDVEIVNPTGKIDDLIVQWGPEAQANFHDLPRVDPAELVQSPTSLAKRYNLAFKQDAKGNLNVLQHTSNIMTLMEEHPSFPKIWRNEDNYRIMVGDEEAKPNYTEMDIANYFQHNLGFDKVTDRVIRACVVALARKNQRSPFLDYVKAQEWDGVARLDTWLQKHWGVEDSPFVQEVGAKWLISACARMDRPGTKIDWMMIVVGPQGTGKTTMPGILFQHAYRSLYGEQNDKDFHMILHSSLCTGFDELDSFGKKESSTLKAMITRNEDAFRPPYGASVEIFPRRFTLYGCGNRYEFLQHDPSGYRRYAVVEIARLLDFAGLADERDQLWAEAWNRYTEGSVKFWEVEGASAEAEKHVVANPMEDQIIGWIETQKFNKAYSSVKDGVLYFTMSQLLGGINMDNASRNTHVTREISAILRALGAEQTNSRKSPVAGVFGRYYTMKV